jgi:hypothetical protein
VGSDGRSHGLVRAAAGAGTGSGGDERVRERERCERGREDAGEGLREIWAFKWAFFPFSLFMSFNIASIYSLRNGPSRVWLKNTHSSPFFLFF